VAWPKVTRPTELGGLGISNLQQLVWPSGWDGYGYRRENLIHRWHPFKYRFAPQQKAFFSLAIISEVGNGKNTLFWTDRWLHGQSVAQLAPNLFRTVSKRAKTRTVHEALDELRWVQDIQGDLQ